MPEWTIVDEPDEEIAFRNMKVPEMQVAMMLATGSFVPGATLRREDGVEFVVKVASDLYGKPLQVLHNGNKIWLAPSNTRTKLVRVPQPLQGKVRGRDARRFNNPE